MMKIAAILFPMVATVLMGVAVIAVLAADMQSTWQPILWGALGALVVSFPVTWLIARQIPGVMKS